MTTLVNPTGAGQTEVGLINDAGGQVFNVTNPAFGAMGDTVQAASGGSIAANSQAFTQTGYTFTANDVGKAVTVQGAGQNGTVLSTTISTFVNTRTVTLATAAGTTVTNAAFTYGTDDTVAMMKAIKAAGPTGAVFAPAGVFTIRGATYTANGGDGSGGGAILITTSGGLIGQGGRPAGPQRVGNTVFLCGDSNAGIIARTGALYRGFMVDGNNIATSPWRTSTASSTSAAAGVEVFNSISQFPNYAGFSDIWSARSAADGWQIAGCQNNWHSDCGTIDNARDGLYMDAGPAGLDFLRFYESGSLRYGVRVGAPSPGTVRTTAIPGAGDIRFFGGAIDANPARSRASAVYEIDAYGVEFHGTTIDGSNLTGPTIVLDQSKTSTGAVNESTTTAAVFERCRIYGSAGQPCILLTGQPQGGNRNILVDCYGSSFESGDYSLYFATADPYLMYLGEDWARDATKYGPGSASGLPGGDVLVSGRTGAWQQATLTAPWTGSVFYRVMAEGWIQFKGSAQTPDGKAGTMFALPLGYRPQTDPPRAAPVAVIDAGTTPSVGQITISPGGNLVTPAGVALAAIPGASAYKAGTVVYLDGATFPVRGSVGANWG